MFRQFRNGFKHCDLKFAKHALNISHPFWMHSLYILMSSGKKVHIDLENEHYDLRVFIQ